MVFPPAPKKGDTIGLVSTSSPVSGERVDACKSLLESWGYRVKVGSSAYTSLHGYLAGPGAARAADLNGMFADPEVRAVFCIRGGDGGCHLMDKLDLEVIRANPKLFVGYSDITVFHVLLNQQLGMVTIHGPMVSSNMVDNYDNFTKESFEATLALPDTGIMELKNPAGEPFKALCAGQAEGTVAGGNLSLLCSMLGTPYEIDTRGKILFFEDVNETTCHVDRMLHHLRYSGKLDEAKGILVGDFSGQSNKADPAYLVDELLQDFFAGYEKPVIRNVKSGHCYPMSSIPLGAVCRMDATGGAGPKIEFFMPRAD